jgi:hypothetical protein
MSDITSFHSGIFFNVSTDFSQQKGWNPPSCVSDVSITISQTSRNQQLQPVRLAF